MQPQKRILAIHDISCVGRCSLTVALPIISSVGIECSVLPTAVLSTHTGGFTGYTYRDLTEDMDPVREHWDSLGLKFDAIYTGFLGSQEQVGLVGKVIEDVSKEGTTVYVDPVMGDDGKLYSVFDEEFPQQMRRLCECADVIMPNLTELTRMLGLEYRPGPYTHEYIDGMLEAARVFGAKKIVLTGISFKTDWVGAVYKDYETGDAGEVVRREIRGYYHGTGDVFGSALVGALESGLPLEDAVRAAVDLTVSSITRTYNAETDVRYGVNFEAGLKEYIKDVEGGLTGIQLIPASSDRDLELMEGIGKAVWAVAHDGKEGSMDTVGELRQRISEGYVYMMIPEGNEIVGYVGFVPRGDSLHMTNIRLLEGSRGKGLEETAMDYVRSCAMRLGYKSVTAHVNRHSRSAMAMYRDSRFCAVGEEERATRDGKTVKVNVMELVI